MVFDRGLTNSGIVFLVNHVNCVWICCIVRFHMIKIKTEGILCEYLTQILAFLSGLRLYSSESWLYPSTNSNQHSSRSPLNFDALSLCLMATLCVIFLDDADCTVNSKIDPDESWRLYFQIFPRDKNSFASSAVTSRLRALV